MSDTQVNSVLMLDEWTSERIAQLIAISIECELFLHIDIVMPMTSNFSALHCAIDCRFGQYFFKIYNGHCKSSVKLKDSQITLESHVTTLPLLQTFLSAAIEISNSK